MMAVVTETLRTALPSAHHDEHLSLCMVDCRTHAVINMFPPFRLYANDYTSRKEYNRKLLDDFSYLCFENETKRTETVLCQPVYVPDLSVLYGFRQFFQILIK